MQESVISYVIPQQLRKPRKLRKFKFLSDKKFLTKKIETQG